MFAIIGFSFQGAKEFFTTLTTAVGVTTKTDYRNACPPTVLLVSSVAL
jgi:hypothetical protein